MSKDHKSTKTVKFAESPQGPTPTGHTQSSTPSLKAKEPQSEVEQINKRNDNLDKLTTEVENYFSLFTIGQLMTHFPGTLISKEDVRGLEQYQSERPTIVIVPLKEKYVIEVAPTTSDERISPKGSGIVIDRDKLERLAIEAKLAQKIKALANIKDKNANDVINQWLVIEKLVGKNESVYQRIMTAMAEQQERAYASFILNLVNSLKKLCKEQAKIDNKNTDPDAHKIQHELQKQPPDIQQAIIEKLEKDYSKKVLDTLASKAPTAAPSTKSNKKESKSIISKVLFKK